MERVTKVKTVTTKKDKSNDPARNYCFTTYLPFENEVVIMKELKDLKYMIYGVEVCPKTSQIHFQGYLELKKPMRIAALKKLGIKTTHFEKRRGTQQQAIDYCKKDGKWQETGTLTTEQGKRNDLDAIKVLLDSGKTVDEIAQMKEHFATYIKHQRSLRDYENVLNKSKKRTNVPQVWVYFGKSGSGKTTKAKKDLESPNPQVLIKPTSKNGQIWWDQDKDNRFVLIEEFDSGWIPWDTFKVWLDSTDVSVEFKGGKMPLLAEHFIITSNKSPLEWYPKQDDLEPLLRRITKALRFEKGTFGENFTEVTFLTDCDGGVTEVPLLQKL